MKPQPPIYLPPQKRATIWQWLFDFLAGVGMIALLCIAIFLLGELVKT